VNGGKLNESGDGSWPLGRRSRAGLLCALALLVVLALPRWLPKPPLSDLAPSSRSITATGGELLRLTLASDEQYRLWTPLDDIAPPMREAVLLYEDRWFYWHIGVNPWALVRAAGSTAVGQRRMGGSTITMQLARRAYGIDSRDYKGKLRQVAAALVAGVALQQARHSGGLSQRGTLWRQY
jgi:penicillin-binding protein 1C